MTWLTAQLQQPAGLAMASSKVVTPELRPADGAQTLSQHDNTITPDLSIEARISHPKVRPPFQPWDQGNGAGDERAAGAFKSPRCPHHLQAERAREPKSKRSLFELLDGSDQAAAAASLEEAAAPATPAVASRVQCVAPGAPKRKLELLHARTTSRRLSLTFFDCDENDSASSVTWLERRRARLWRAEPEAPPRDTDSV